MPDPSAMLPRRGGCHGGKRAVIAVEERVPVVPGPALQPAEGSPGTVALEQVIQRLEARQQVIVDTLDRLSREVEAGRAGALPASAPAEVEGLLSAPPGLAVYCLGSFEVKAFGLPTENWGGGKTLALFEYLVTHRNRPVPRETLIDALWPNPDAVAARTSLKVAIHGLRQLLGRLSADESMLGIETLDTGYQLNAPALWLDVEEFERCCAQGRRHDATGNPAEAVASFRRATALYRGDFLEQSSEEWVLLRREALKDLYLLAVARLADAALAEGDYAECIDRCQQLLEQDRCREDAYQVLMVCHARLGQRGRVKRWFEVCERTLRTELDVEPDPDTVAVYHQALAGRVPTPDGGAGSNGWHPAKLSLTRAS